MASFAPPLEHLLATLIKEDPARVSKDPAGTALTVLATFFGLAGLGFLSAAGYGWLQEQYGVRVATLYMGGGTLALAALCAIIASMIVYARQVKAKTYAKIVMENIHSAIHTVTQELEEPIQENPKTAALIATMAGYMAAKNLL